MKIWLIFFISLCLFSLGSSSQDKKCYRGAVFEHIKIAGEDGLDPEDPLKYIRQNLAAYDEAAKRARNENAQILVTPEEGLFGPSKLKGRPEVSKRGANKLVAEDIPDPKDGPFNPCTQTEFESKPILRELSCIARKSNIYLVATHADIKNCSGEHSCPEDGVFIYNTQIAFDRKGQLIGRYHKYHLFGEFHFNVPKKIELVYFDTDFGVRFGMYICFDRLFRDPMLALTNDYNVTTMALSTWFFDEHPFYLSHQIDQSWAQRLQINILSANSKMLKLGTTGSGIFTPYSAAAYEHDTNTKGSKSESVVLVANAPVHPKSGHECDPNPQRMKLSHFRQPGQHYSYYTTDMTPYTLVKLTEDCGKDVTVCNGDLCCQLDYTMAETTRKQGDEETVYVFGAVSRMRTGYFTSNYPTCEQNCLLAAYNPDSNKFSFETKVKFAKIQMSGNFSTPYIYSTALTSRFKLIQNKDLVYGDNSLEVESKKPVLLAGMHGRCYDKDPPYVQGDYRGQSISDLMKMVDPVNGVSGSLDSDSQDLLEFAEKTTQGEETTQEEEKTQEATNTSSQETSDTSPEKTTTTAEITTEAENNAESSDAVNTTVVGEGSETQ